MHYAVYAPPLSLAPYIQRFWVHESSAAEPFSYRSTADVYCKLIFHYRGRFSEILENDTRQAPQVSFQAQTVQSSLFTTSEQIGIFGIAFYPHAIPALFGIPASELSNQTVDLATLCPEKAYELEQRILEACSTAERIAIITQFISSLKCTSHPMMRAIRTILVSNGKASIPELAASHGLSRRQFERSFKSQAGFSPKVFARIARFQAIADSPAETGVSLGRRALDAGYYDQSHFINEFKRFAGASPTQYFSA